MTELGYCPRFHTALAADTHAGLCPSCLMQLGPGLLVSEVETSRFQNEAKVIANLRHPNIVTVHEVGAHDGQRYFSIDGVSAGVDPQSRDFRRLLVSAGQSRQWIG